MLRGGLITFCAVALGGTVLAQTPPANVAPVLAQPNPSDCRAVTDEKARLACFDRTVGSTLPAAPAVAPPATGSAPEPSKAAAPAPVPTAVAPARTPITVDAADLGVGSRKYIGKLLELKGVRCYYADVNDYRCLTGVDLTVFATALAPAEQKKLLEEYCGELRKVLSTPDCVRTIRFVLEAGDIGEDTISGNRTRTVISPDEVEVMPPSPPARRRR